MAGIGFELKKLFRKTGFFASVRAYGYAAVVTTGPLLLGILLLLGIMVLCMLAGTERGERELLTCMITYALLGSLLVTSFFSMPVTRYVSDMLFEERKEEVLPCFWGSAVLMLALGGLLWLVFLLFSGATFVQGVLLFLLFQVLVVAWHAMSFLSAVKDYRHLLLSFFVGISVALLLGYLLILLRLPVLESLLVSVSVGYSIKLLWDISLLYRYFPDVERPSFAFMAWMDKFRELPWVGLFTNIGMYTHLVIMWFSEVGVQVKGLFYGAPYHDVPAICAYLTILITTVNFVVSVEVNFYPKYRNYSSLYNDKGVVGDIEQAENEMLKVLKTELFYTALKQLLCTALAIAVGGFVLDLLPLGFNDTMKGYFRTLCVGYGLYAVGNTVMLILLYFVDYAGAFWATAAFAAGSILLSLASLLFPSVYYGFGFLLASLLFFLITIFRLDYYTKRLPYYILCVQPLVAKASRGMYSRASERLEKLLGEEVHL